MLLSSSSVNHMMQITNDKRVTNLSSWRAKRQQTRRERNEFLWTISWWRMTSLTCDDVTEVSFIKCKTSLFSSSILISMYKMIINMLKLNSTFIFLIEKLKRLENLSCIWQWWQYLFRCSMTRDSTLSCFDRVRISYKQRVERWSKRRWRRRSSISINKHEFS
jgi:hypothetical protein